MARRPGRRETTAWRAWCRERLAAQGLSAVRRLWDNASWHSSHDVRTGLRQHHHHVKQTGPGGRILAGRLPRQSPWLHPMEPKGVHGKRAIVAPARWHSAREIMERVYTSDGGAEEAPRVISEKAA